MERVAESALLKVPSPDETVGDQPAYIEGHRPEGHPELNRRALLRQESEQAVSAGYLPGCRARRLVFLGVKSVAKEKRFQTKRFTRDYIDSGVAKLRRRIDEIQALKTDSVKHNDQRVNNAQLNMHESIREIFGDESAEYDRYRYVRIWKGSLVGGDSQQNIQQKFEAGIPNAVELLEGLIGRLEEKRDELDADKGKRAAAALTDLELHPRIGNVVARLFEDGHYANAVLDGAIALTNHVKEKSGRHDLDGADLMRTVFSANTPVLAFNELRDQTDRVEQEGMMHLFEGVALGVRDPRAHQLFDHHPQRALEYIVLLSLLAKRVDEAQKVEEVVRG